MTSPEFIEAIESAHTAGKSGETISQQLFVLRNGLQEGKKIFKKDLRPLIMALLAQEKIKYAKKQTASSRSFQDRLTRIENTKDTKQYIARAIYESA